MTSMNSIKSQKKKADAKAKKDFTKQQDDIGAIHQELSGYLSNLNTGLKSDYESSMANTTAANQALKSRLATESLMNRNNAQSEQQRLGLGQVGMGSFDQDAAFSGQVADRSGADFLANLRLAQANASSAGALQEGMNKGQEESAIGQYRNAYDDKLEANTEAYDKMVSQYKDQQAAAAAYRRSSYTPYRSNYTPYRSNYTPYRAPYRAPAKPKAPAKKKSTNGFFNANGQINNAAYMFSKFAKKYGR